MFSTPGGCLPCPSPRLALKADNGAQAKGDYVPSLEEQEDRHLLGMAEADRPCLEATVNGFSVFSNSLL